MTETPPPDSGQSDGSSTNREEATRVKSADFPRARGLGAGFSVIDDRLVLLARTVKDDVRTVMLTRRILRALLDNYVRILRDTSPAAARAPAPHREEVLHMEHLGALNESLPGANDADGSDEASKAVIENPFLVVDVILQPKDELFLLGFLGVPLSAGGAWEPTSPQPIIAVSLTRGDAHRFLSLLIRKSKEAGWDLADRYGWLASADEEDFKAGARN